MRIDNDLIKLDFAPGIKASDINYNFKLLKDWSNRERRRIGGYGIVEGFKITADPKNFKVTVGKGTFISNTGEEINVKEEIFEVSSPEYITKTQIARCNNNGILFLNDRPYSPSQLRYMEYAPPTIGRYPDIDEIYLEEAETQDNVPILQISENKIYIDADYWYGHPIKVTYKQADNRVDTIYLTTDGEYKYERSVDSPSPSHVQLNDYPDEYVIGAILWKIDDKITTKVYDNHRLYRSLFVDENNKLWINGEIYKKPAIIHFIKPEIPEENMLWYDRESNNIMIWKESDGIWGWTAVNDHSTATVKESYYFRPGENFPKDAQTFLFPEEDIQYRFAPNHNALQITIDNTPLMQDQFTEIVRENEDKEYLSQGIGFRLNDPLDRETHVEVIVNHEVRSKPTLETFQRAAIFVSENYIVYSESNTEKIFETTEPYVLGEDQLEVFVEGKRLISGVDFDEMLNETTVAEKNDKKTKDKMSHHFRVKKKLTEGQNVNYKISKHIWSYDQISLLLKEMKKDVEEEKKKNTILQNKINALEENFRNYTNTISEEIKEIKSNMPDIDNLMKKDTTITIDKLDYSISSRLMSPEFIEENMPTTMLSTIQGIDENDYINVFYVSSIENRILIKNVDYSIVKEVNGIKIELEPTLINSNSIIYIKGFKLGAGRK